jgi:hypothetical protein
VKRSKTTTIELAMRLVARDCADYDRLTAAACLEAADRLEEMRELLSEAASWVGGLPEDLLKRMTRAAK